MPPQKICQTQTRHTSVNTNTLTWVQFPLHVSFSGNQQGLILSLTFPKRLAALLENPVDWMSETGTLTQQKISTFTCTSKVKKVILGSTSRSIPYCFGGWLSFLNKQKLSHISISPYSSLLLFWQTIFNTMRASRFMSFLCVTNVPI